MSQPPAKELRRANIDGHLWLELVMLPPNAMAGAKYYACQVLHCFIFFSITLCSLPFFVSGKTIHGSHACQL